MPTRTYEGIDFINYIEGFNSNLADLPGQFKEVAAVATPVNKFDVLVNASTTNNGAANNQSYSAEAHFEYQVSGDLDFDVFPSIPDGAQITKVEVQFDAEVSGNASAQWGGGGGLNSISTAIGRVAAYRGLAALPSLVVTDSDPHGIPAAAPNPMTSILAAADHFTAIETFDYTGAPIDKGTLIANFTSWSVLLSGQMVPSALGLNPGPTEAVSLDISVRIDGFRVTVTYVDGPVSIVLTPSGGNVEKGQIITATGPGAAEQTYIAVVDGKVIPIEPKIISPTEVSLEIPYPASDPCFDCFGDCPICDACFDACEADLESDACAECVQACLDCLTQCLESLQSAEECQQSTGNNGESTTTVVIYCGTQFGGSVLLGTFTILVANGSGIYRFEMGKTSDTIYTADRDGTTYEVKIPNPGATTGFFRS